MGHERAVSFWGQSREGVTLLQQVFNELLIPSTLVEDFVASADSSKIQLQVFHFLCFVFVGGSAQHRAEERRDRGKVARLRYSKCCTLSEFLLSKQ